MKDKTSAARHADLSPFRALIALVCVATALTGYLVLAHLMGIGPTFAGILIVFYLFAMEGGALSALPKAFIGALGGLANGALFAIWPGTDPNITAVAGLLAVLSALYCLLIGLAPILFNHAYMLVLTVACVPCVLLEADFPGMLAAMGLSLLYFGGILWAADLIRKRHARAKARRSNE